MLRRLFVVAWIAFPTLASAECLTTLPPYPPFVPPPPFGAASPSISDGWFWQGTDSLWTNVPLSATWNMKDNVGKGKFFRTKLIYWRKGFNWRTDQPELIVTAKRLDKELPVVFAERADAVFPDSPAPAMMTAINIPTVGCWEITGQYKDATVSFVVSVEP